jgi:hypothetical protein
MTVRLTLRTLLAYLDDTLEPLEIKHIGQKVAESDAAQELVARIKQVTRRRRLTTPPDATPGGRFDANVVAEYLDNELPTEQVSDLEKLCLESDIHLAEISSCHQILTLVLGEPALVPPTAKERMYGLVQGREAIPFRKAASPAAGGAAPNATDRDADEMLLLGLPLYRRGSWLRWALPLAGIFLLIALGVSLWLAMPRSNRQVADNRNNSSTDTSTRVELPSIPPDKGSPDKGTGEKGTGEKGTGEKKKETETRTKPPEEKKESPMPEDPGAPRIRIPEPPNPGGQPPSQPVEATPAVAPPAADRAEVGVYYRDPKSPESVLVTRKGDGDWQRVVPGRRVFTTDPLVSLPGYASEIRTDRGVHLLLRGHVREFTPPQPELALMNYLMESAAVLHPSADFDLDLTFDRGRLYVSNHKEKGPAKVRLRFGKGGREVWDLTLQEPGAEVGVDLLKHYTRDINWRDGEEPRAELYLIVLKGKANLRMNTYHFSDLTAPPGPALFVWDNKGSGAQGPIRVEKVPAFWDKTLSPPAGNDASKWFDEMKLALVELSKRMVENKPLGVALAEARQPNQPLGQRLLSIYALCALDGIRDLFDVLEADAPEQAPDRNAAIFTLRQWISRGAEQGTLLYDEKKRSGILTASNRYKPGEAEIILVLLHDFSVEAADSRETYELLADYLISDRKAIAELAYWHLYHLSQGTVKLPIFNAGMPRALREEAAKEVHKLIDTGKLPPPKEKEPTAPPKKDKK